MRDGDRMLETKRRRIHRLADEIRMALELEVPVDAALAVNRLGGNLAFVACLVDDIDAMIEKTSGSFKVTIREGVSLGREKFSIAHEIGHLFLHMGFQIEPTRWAVVQSYKDSVRFRFGYSEEELEANEFAAAFLMPKDEFEQIVSCNTRNNRCDLNAVAGCFGVSVEAARTRGRWLGLFEWD